MGLPLLATALLTKIGYRFFERPMHRWLLAHTVGRNKQSAQHCPEPGLNAICLTYNKAVARGPAAPQTSWANAAKAPGEPTGNVAGNDSANKSAAMLAPSARAW